MILKQIIYFGKKCVLICDGKCQKAWGMNSRPKKALSFDINDWELQIAPDDPGTYEGECGKPKHQSDKLNKWCARECERSSIVKDLEEFKLKDFSARVSNTIGEQT